jgi:hypothetical protein
MKKSLRLCVVIFLIGLSLLFVVVVRINSVPRLSFGNEDGGDTSGWVMYPEFLMFYRDFRVDIRVNDTVSVYILDEVAVKQWKDSKIVDAVWAYENVVGGVFSEQANGRGSYAILVHLPDESITAIKVALTFSGFEKDLLIFSSIVFCVGILSSTVLLISKLKNKNR